jgi:hypothetical protein
MTYKLYKVFLLFLVLSVLTVGAFAQNANSSIRGTVEDASGAIVPNAAVTLTNVGTTQQLTTTTNAHGFYIFPNLGPTNYRLSATGPGFAKWVGVLTLRVSQDAEVDPKLTAASVSTKITVRDVTPIIDRVNPTLSDVKNSTAIETVPEIGRNILSVLAFSPGVVANDYGGSGGGYTRVNGVPGGSMAYLVDGQTMATHWTNELQQDAQTTMTFQEVKIITAQGDAQYSKPGVVELVTKSGTNQFHGQAYELNTNQHFQARGFRSGPLVPFDQHNEFGGQLGGPVWFPKIYNGRNKTFFFVDWEKIKDKANAFEQYIVPTETEREGNLSTLKSVSTGDQINIYDPDSTVYDPITDTYARTQLSYNGVPNVIPPTRLNPAAEKELDINPPAGLFPLPEPNINVSPTAMAVNFTPNLIPTNLSVPTDETTFTAKVDQLFGPNRLAMRYTYTNSSQVQPQYYAPTDPDLISAGGDNFSVEYTEVVSPHAVNVVHGGFTYNHAFRGPEPHPGASKLLGLPVYQSDTYQPQFYFNGSNTDTYWVGIDRDNPQDYPNQEATLGDQFSYNRGNHQMLFGFDADDTRINTYEDGQPGGNYDDFNGDFTGLQDPNAFNSDGSRNYAANVANSGSGLADFLLGDIPSVSVNTYPHYHTRQAQVDFYAQDNWRVTPKLTMNLGLRYTYWTPFTDSNNYYSTLDPNIPGGMVVYAGTTPGKGNAQIPASIVNSFKAAGLPIESSLQAGYPSSLFTMPKANFEPRLGFAYQINSKTVVRSGWGIYQWIIPLQQFEQAARKNPPFSYSAQLNIGETPQGVFTNGNAAALEFPVASAAFAGPQPINQWMLGSQNCTNEPAGTCTKPGLLVNTSDVQITEGGGFGIAPLLPDYKPSTTQEYSLGIQRELPWNTGVQLTYIGNHSYNLLENDPINFTVPRANCAVAGVTDVAACQNQVTGSNRPYTVFTTSGVGNYSLFRYDGFSNTNELEAQVQHTFGGGLLVQGYFTWGKFLTTSEDSLLGVGELTIPAASTTPGYTIANPLTSGTPLPVRLAEIYGNDSNLPAKTIQFNAHYVLPFGQGQRFLGNAHGFLNALVSGYSFSPFFEWHSGFYFAPYMSGNSVGGQPALASSYYLAPGKTGILPKGQRSPNAWFNASVWDPTSGAPYQNQTFIYYGNKPSDSYHNDFPNNIPRNYMTGPGFNEMDADVYKVTPLWRNLDLDFEAQILNIYNHINMGLPNSQGQILNGNGTPRHILLQAKIIF